MIRPGAMVLAVLALLAACASTGSDAVVRGPVGSTAPATTPGPSPEPDPGRRAVLSGWEACGGGFECATLTVPRNWSEPDGARLDLAVIRLPASGDRVGSLVVNPGGPGASGVDFVRAFVENDGVPVGLDESFDLVSWDPRGTGASEPVDCTTDEQWLEPDLDPTPDSAADVEAIRTEATDARDRCDAQAGDLLPLVGTRATVEDLDALRSTLGDEQLTYVGYSYGTTIGLEYLRAHPTRVRAMVLDGVSPPGVDPVDDTLTQARGFERTLDSYLADCPRRPTCTLGADPKAALLGLVADLEAARVPASYTLGDDDTVREGTVGVGELYVAVASSLYSRSSWPTLDDALAEASSEPRSGVTLLALRDEYLGRQADGTWDDDSDARAAIRCADQVERVEEPEGDPDLVEAWEAEMPFWGAWFAVGTPGCWGFAPATEALSPLAPGSITEAPPVLLIGSTNDPATPYEQAVAAQAAVEGSRLLTYEGDEHTIYKNVSACVDAVATSYLVDLAVPAADVRCSD